MAHVLIALGSNTRQEAHIQWASEQLTQLLHGVRFSRTLWTPDIHGTGAMYLNRLAAGDTALAPDALERELKRLEAETGRTAVTRAETDRTAVTLDLDLMQYDAERYHLRDWPRPYIQQLLPDLQ